MQPLQGARGCVGPDVAASVPWVRDKQPACFGETKPKTPCVHRTWVSAHTGVGGLPTDGSPREAGWQAHHQGPRLFYVYLDCLSF